MLFRFTLENDILGSLVINEPDGWKDCKLKLERDKNFHSLIEYFDGSFIFYGNKGVVDGGINYIKEVEQTQGFDAEIRINIRVSFDGYSFQHLFSGQLNLALSQELPDNKIQIPIIRDDFWSKFINRLDTPVNIQDYKSLDEVDIDFFDSINLRLTSQKINKSDHYKQDVGLNMTFDSSTDNIGLRTDYYMPIELDNTILEEITESFEYPLIENPDVPFYKYLMEYSGDYTFDIKLSFTGLYYNGPNDRSGRNKSYTDLTYGTNPGSISSIEVYIQKNNEAPIALTRNLKELVTSNPGLLQTHFDATGTPVDTTNIQTDRWVEFVYNNTLTLQKDDTIYLYLKILNSVDPPYAFTSVSSGGTTNTRHLYLIGDSNDFVSDIFFPLTFFGESDSYIRVTGATLYPESNAFSFLLHDVAGQIVDRITSFNDRFYSEHLGSDRTLYRQYPADGCGWKYALSKGLQIRQYSLFEKPFFLSFNQWWKGINPVLCLGLCYEEVNGTQVIRIEEMEHFYDASTTSLDISNVRQITRTYDQEVIFKTIRVGYTKWQSEDISGIDDAQTKHVYATRFVKTGSELNIESEFVAASLAIETTRRTSRIKSADYKFDNDTFLIAINPIPVDVSPETSPDVSDYVPELDENFTSIDNLLNAETRYNSRITPARNIMRWIRYISGALQSYLDSKFKFVSGEGNYDMTSDMSNVSDGCDEIKREISEKEDLPVYDDPLHLALSYEIRVPLEWEDYLTIRENRKKAIGISQTTTGHVKFFIDTLEYELVEGIATIKAWPVEYFDIQVIEEVPAMRSCIPVVVENCEDAYLTEDSFEYETEAGECFILE